MEAQGQKIEPLVKQSLARAYSNMMAHGHASAWPGSIFTQLCLVWSKSSQVGHLADHSGSLQSCQHQKQTSAIFFDPGTCGWALMNMVKTQHMVSAAKNNLP